MSTNTTNTRIRLLSSARQLGAALAGIEAISEILAGAEVDHTEAATWVEPLTAKRALGLLAAVGALAQYARTDLEHVMGDGDPDGEELMMWGGGSHLYPSCLARTAA